LAYPISRQRAKMGQVAPAGQPLSAARTWANVNMSLSGIFAREIWLSKL
jgi:hypothetical protein